MSSQGQLEGLSDTAFSQRTTTGKGKAQASEETESINTTRKGYGASRAIGCIKLTMVLEKILSNVSPSPDKSKMTSRGKIEKY